MARRPHLPKASDRVMFPWASGAMTPELIVWAALTHFRDGAAPADVAEHLLLWGLAEGDRPPVHARVAQFFENLVAAPPNSRGAARLPNGRYKAVLRQPARKGGA